ncbi:MAG: hypothetical protein JOZ69_03045, partial [Myxococcales bacterium]|nr:hypothetical protein [Myxococcales bacterium]
SADEHLPTTRLGALLPPISPPPNRSRPPSSPPPSVPLAPAAVLGDDAPLEPKVRRPGPAAAQPSSWWASLGTLSGPDLDRIRRPLGVVAAGVGLMLALLGVVLAFRGVPSDPPYPAGVTASLVLSRTLAALALAGLGWGLVRVGERAFFSRE